jgi:hypothetical protein
MEARRSKRAILDIPAEIINKDKRSAGTIENLSDEGIYMVTAPIRSEKDFSPGTEIEIRFRLLSGEKLNLRCIVKWSYLTPPHGYTFSIGLRIIDPPLTFKEAVKTLI